MDRDCAGPSLSRRAVLGTAGALFAWAHMPRIALAAGNRDARFICIVLRGGMDGLAVVGPVGDPDYAGLHGDLALRLDGPAPALPLDGFFALNPFMPETARLYRAGQVAVVHAAATNYRDRSHFDAQDVLESGQPAPGLVRSGWLNRALAGLAVGERVNPAGRMLGVGAVPPLIVRGPQPVLGWAPARLGAPDPELIGRLERLYAGRDPRLLAALQEGARVEGIASIPAPKKGETRLPEVEMADGVARLMVADDGPRIAALAIDGWDSHSDAASLLRRRLSGLDAAFATFEAGFGDKWKDTAILVVTEFGRTARINGTRGTDHGNGTVAFLVGGAVRGSRVIADWPGLSETALLDGRDLRPTTDVRALAKGLLADLYGASDGMLAETVFPGSRDVAPMSGLVV
ncbi:DUF1501 domain-containing protein [Segnochrobactraceae bacterium EtOH-i3]